MSEMTLSMGVVLADIVVVRKQLIEIDNGNNNRYLKNNAAYTHNLVLLSQYAKSIGVELSIPQYIADNLILITNWEVRGRYDMHLTVRIDRLRHCNEVIEIWYEELKRKGLK